MFLHLLAGLVVGDGRPRTVWWWRLRAREACLQVGQHWMVLPTQTCLWCGACSRDPATIQLAEGGSSRL